MAKPHLSYYYDRKARGQCPACGNKVDAGMTYCWSCLDERRPDARQQARADAEARRLAPGPNQMACCGDFHPILPNPLRMACCGRELKMACCGGMHRILTNPLRMACCGRVLSLEMG